MLDTFLLLPSLQCNTSLHLSTLHLLSFTLHYPLIWQRKELVWWQSYPCQWNEGILRNTGRAPPILNLGIRHRSEQST